MCFKGKVLPKSALLKKEMEPGEVDAAANLVAKEFPKKSDKFIQYGTAGFRTKANDLPHVICRMGLLAVIRSKKKRATIGVMITASHNPEEDNGVKLVDPMGEMLEMVWEKHATNLANVIDSALGETLSSIVSTENIDMSKPAKVCFARDTRPSSKSLSQALQTGIEALNGQALDYGLLTTPQLHYMVRCLNSQGSYGTATEDGYYQKLSSAFHKLQKTIKEFGNYSSSIVLDAACGIGALKIHELSTYLGDSLTINNLDYESKGILNEKCGADFVKVNQRAPEKVTVIPGMKCVSFDGDADRIVYFFRTEDGKFHLLDGDRIATLVAGYIQDLLQKSGLKLNLGLVQTAYANGSSTKYITQSLKVPVACVATGVKHLHHKAQEFDIGVYFEANGHGTVLFSDEALISIEKAVDNSNLTTSERTAANALSLTVDLINQTVGDAISDMLLVEIILMTQGWSLEDWNSCYNDLPNRQMKVKVKDRTVIKTTADETKATSPAGLQGAIDDLVAKYNSSRSFVRPSGTEDIVRVYAEADTQESADKLAHEVSLVVYSHAGGVGDKPGPP